MRIITHLRHGLLDKAFAGWATQAHDACRRRVAILSVLHGGGERSWLSTLLVCWRTWAASAAVRLISLFLGM